MPARPEGVYADSRGQCEHPPHPPHPSARRRTSVPYLKVGWLVRFDPAEIASWLDGSRHSERSTAGDRTRLAVSFSRSASRIREIGCLDSGRQTDCARSETFRWSLRI